MNILKITRYKNIIFLGFLTVLICYLISGCTINNSEELEPEEEPNIIIIVIDGARYSETFGDENHSYVSNIWNNLRPNGSIFTSFFIDSAGKTFTNPGHASILTGTWQSIDNQGEDRPTKPTIFEYYRKRKNKDLNDVQLIVSKPKLEILSYSTSKEYGESFRASSFSTENYGDDLSTIEKVKEVVISDKPKLMMINLGGTDVAGHSGNFDRYVSALSQADSLIYDFWQFVRHQKVYKDNTYIFITNDHGRHLEGIKNEFQGHGDNCLGCRHIMLLAIGPRISEGKIITTKYCQIDMAKTIGRIMNFSTEYAEGLVIDPMFK